MIVDSNFSIQNLKLYSSKGKLLASDKPLSTYFKSAKHLHKVKVQLFNVLTLKICYKLTKLVTFSDDLQTVDDLRKLLIFDEVEEFGDGKLKEEDFRQWFLFTYNFAVIPESAQLKNLIKPNKSSR